MPDHSTDTRKLRGRPPFEPSPEQRHSVELMTAIGIPQDAIALALGISEPTLRKHFRPEISVGKTKVITRVADALVRQALAGNITAMIFFLKTRAGWSEKTQVEHSGSIERMTDAQLEAIARGDPGV